MVGSKLLLTIAICMCYIAFAASQQQQGGVSWETAPECPDSGGGTAVDSQGRVWGWANGQSCKRSNGAATAAQQQASWDSAPPCSTPATPDNSKPDSQGRLWGWQDGRSCKHTGALPYLSSISRPPPTITWETAPPCGYKPTGANSRADRQGRYWGWQNGISCKFDQPPQHLPLSSPPSPPPDPLRSGQRPTAAPSPLAKQRPVAVAPAPTAEEAVKAIPTPAAGRMRPQVVPTPQSAEAEPQQESQVVVEAPEVPAVPSPRPKKAGTVVLSSDLAPTPAPQVAAAPSPEPALAPDFTLRFELPSPSPAPSEGSVTITPSTGLPSPSPAVADEAGAKGQGAAAAAAAAATAAAATAAPNSTGVVDAVNVTAAELQPAPAAAAAAEGVEERARGGQQQTTNLVLGYEGTPLSEFNEQYAAGSLKSVSQVAGVSEVGITQTIAAAPADDAAPAAAPAAPAAEPQAAPQQQQQQAGVATASANKTAAAGTGSNTTAAAATAPKTDVVPAQTPGGAAAAAASAAAAAAAQNLTPSGSATAAPDATAGQAAPQGNATATPAPASAPGRKLLLAPHQQQQALPQQLLLGGITWQLRRLHSIGDNTYATYAITSASPAVTARTVTAAARDGTLYQTLERNGVPLRPSVSLNGNMLQKGQPGVFGAKPGSTGLSAGAIAGIVIGSIVGVALLAGLALLCCLCCRKKRKADDGAKAAAVARAKADLAKTRPNGGGKKPLLNGSPNSTPAKVTAQARPPKTPSPSVRKPRNLMDRFASWGAPQEANLGPSTGTGTAPPAAAAATAPSGSGTAPAAAAAAAATAAVAGAAAAKKGRSSSPSSTMRGSKARDQYYREEASFDEDTYYYQGGGSSDRRGGSKSTPEGEEMLQGVPSLSGKSSLSKHVSRDRALTINKLGIAGNPKYVTGRSASRGKHSEEDDIPRPMSIKERVERDRQMEAAESKTPSEVYSAAADTSESSYAPSALTYNSMEPMEKAELAAAAMSLQARRASAPSGPIVTESGATVPGASHIQQIHISGRRTPLGGHSPLASPLPGRSPRRSPARPARAGATADVAVVTPGVAGSIPSSTTASVSGKSMVDAPTGPPANAETSVGGNGWLWSRPQ